MNQVCPVLNGGLLQNTTPKVQDQDQNMLIWRMKFKFHPKQNLKDFEKQFVWSNVISQQDKKHRSMDKRV